MRREPFVRQPFAGRRGAGKALARAARLRQTLGEGDAGFVSGELGSLEHLSVAFDRDQVASGRRSREGVGRTEEGDIVEGAAGERQERLEREARRLCHPLHLTEEPDKVVGGDASGGVVHGAALVRHHDRLPV